MVGKFKIPLMTTIDLQKHWDEIYQNKKTEQLGWYEAYPEPSLCLIERCHLPKSATLLIAGAGATTLVDFLLAEGYQHLIATDISEVGLNELKKRLTPEQREKVQWVSDDLTDPSVLPLPQPVDLWCDRAVLHFFTESTQRETYFRLVRQSVAPGGYVIIAAFHLEGADRCSGLPVYRYDEKMIAENLGDEFRLREWFLHDYTMPSGEERKYVYTLFQRKG
jgi:SAM-dependent methyltransferase